MITIPLPTKVSANRAYAGMHWAKRKVLADEYHMALIEHRLTRIPTPCDLHFTFEFQGRALDVSNCFLMAKMLEDGMVQWGMFPDDTPKYVQSITIQVRKGPADSIMIEATSPEQMV